MFPTIAEYNQTIQTKGGNAFKTLLNLTFIPSRIVPVKIFSYGSGSYAVVFKAQDEYNTYAIRCFISAEQDGMERYRAMDDYLNNINVSWLANIKFFEKEICVREQLYPVLKMDWINGKLLNNYIDEILINNYLLSTLQNEFVELSKSLEVNQIGHGDIQCGNVIIQTNESGNPAIKLIDYDGMYIPDFKNKAGLERGRAEFQHPLRHMTMFNETIDRFSFWVILCALEALKFDKSLWLPVMQGGYNTLDNMLFSGTDFVNFHNSKLVQRLYTLNQPSLSFYLNRLSKFCNMSPMAVEPPVIFNSTETEINDGAEQVNVIALEGEIEILSNPSGAAVYTAEHQRLGATPLQIGKNAYINKALLVAYGTEIKPVYIQPNDTIVNVHFQQRTVSTPAPIPPKAPTKEESGFMDNKNAAYIFFGALAFIALLVFIIGINMDNSLNNSTQSVSYDTTTAMPSTGQIDTTTASNNYSTTSINSQSPPSHDMTQAALDTLKKASTPLGNYGSFQSSVEQPLTTFDSMVLFDNNLTIDSAINGSPIYDSPNPDISIRIGSVSRNMVIIIDTPVGNYDHIVSGNITGYLNTVNIKR